MDYDTILTQYWKLLTDICRVPELENGEFINISNSLPPKVNMPLQKKWRKRKNGEGEEGRGGEHGGKIEARRVEKEEGMEG